MSFRNTKVRKQQSQTYLKIKSSTLTVSHESDNVYEHTYGIRLPSASYDILLPCVSGFTRGMSVPNAEIRSLHTIGVWCSETGVICRCCFIQPEVASATCTIPASKSEKAISAKKVVSHAIPWANECLITSEPGTVRRSGVTPRTPQISGRMAPYVVDEAGLGNVCVWGFGNLCKTRLLFMTTSRASLVFKHPTRMSIMLLKQYMPDYAACIYDDDMSCYVITVTPDAGGDISSANKHTSLVIYGDGSIKVQGTPSKMEKVCTAFSDALFNIASSRSWSRFLTSMEETKIIEV